MVPKKKEPFRDRVLDKALEYIKGELKKENNKGAQAPAPRVDEFPHEAWMAPANFKRRAA